MINNIANQWKTRYSRKETTRTWCAAKAEVRSSLINYGLFYCHIRQWTMPNMHTMPIMRSAIAKCACNVICVSQIMPNMQIMPIMRSDNAKCAEQTMPIVQTMPIMQSDNAKYADNAICAIRQCQCMQNHLCEPDNGKWACNCNAICISQTMPNMEGRRQE